MGAGDFDQETPHNGAKEIRDLSLAFDRMRLQLRQTQQELLEAERLATIGRMASSISHDLRHHLSAVYANAEFLGYSSPMNKERLELLGEIRLAVQEMTELIESLLMFSRTGTILHLSSESLPQVIERAIALVKSHPDAAGVEIHLNASRIPDIWFDPRKVQRAIYNLILNACQAAARARRRPRVSISLTEEGTWVRLHIQDNGPGVADSIRLTLFEPFVCEGKQNGVGLGLTLAQRIAQEHSGSVTLEESGPDGTVFVLSIAKNLHPSSITVQARCIRDYPDIGRMARRASPSSQPEGNLMKLQWSTTLRSPIAILIAALFAASCAAQEPASARANPEDARYAELSAKLDQALAVLGDTQRELAESRQKMHDLEMRMQAIDARLDHKRCACFFRARQPRGGKLRSCRSTIAREHPDSSSGSKTA